MRTVPAYRVLNCQSGRLCPIGIWIPAIDLRIRRIALVRIQTAIDTFWISDDLQSAARGFCLYLSYIRMIRH